MPTTLSYSSSNFPFTPYTKIRSADVNTCFTDIRSRLNWAGSTDATTGLGDDNIQSNTASGGGLTRATKLKLGTANHVLINDGTGAMSSESALATSRGGLGTALTPTTADDVIRVNSTGTAFELGASPTPPPVKVFNYFSFV